MQVRSLWGVIRLKRSVIIVQVQIMFHRLRVQRRFSSPLGVYDFQKRSSLIMCSQEGVKTLAKTADVLAVEENLDAHAR